MAFKNLEESRRHTCPSDAYASDIFALCSNLLMFDTLILSDSETVQTRDLKG